MESFAKTVAGFLLLVSLSCGTRLSFVDLALEQKIDKNVFAQLPQAQIIHHRFQFKEQNLDEKIYNDLLTPIVLTHGMGDSCFNPGMMSITKAIGHHLGNAYSTCIGTADTQALDTINGFLLNMNREVEYFAKKVKSDPRLQNGFRAMGFSQGNLVIRGYIERYNKPPVKSFISMHGPMMGVASIPHCDPVSGIVHRLCQEMVQLLSTAAYSETVQNMLAQSNYLRDPERMSEYLKTTFLPDLNNEMRINATYSANFESLQQLVLVKAEDDTMIYPKESEWFGAFQDGSYESILMANETRLYKENTFGLRTLMENHRVFFEATPGDHLRFSEAKLFSLLDKYWNTVRSQKATEKEIYFDKK